MSPPSALPKALPTPRTPDPMAAPALRWGILGTGWVASAFTIALQRHTTQQVVAVGSRTKASAQQWALEHGVPAAHASYEALAADPNVDVIYVATTPTFHHANALMALRAGKHVLVEKPMTLNADQARELQAEAAARGLFAMEAMWCFFGPKFDVVRQLLDDGVLGPIHTVTADQGQLVGPGGRPQNAPAGAPTLDAMTYPTAFTHFVVGLPDEVIARSTWTPLRGSGQSSILFTQVRGTQAVLSASVLGKTPTITSIGGLGGRIEFDADYFVPGGFWITSPGGKRLRYDEERIGHDGLFWQACEAARCISAGQLGSDRRPMADTIATLAIMDETRRQIGEYFAEEAKDLFGTPTTAGNAYGKPEPGLRPWHALAQREFEASPAAKD